MKQTIVLAILDGWGIGENNESNAIYMAQPQITDYLEKNFPAGALNSSGLSVGLPWAEEGNSEVGHLTLGAGRVLYQHCLKITNSIETGEFFKKPPLKQSFKHARDNNSSVHLVGLLTKGSVHSSSGHLAALIEFAKQEKITNLYLHLFTDGRDGPPRSALKLLKELGQVIQKHGVGTIATLSGRYYGMDRDKYWDRTQKAYEALTKEGKVELKETALQTAYDKNLNDEFMMPTIVAGPHPIKDNDAIIFFNFREDRMRQLSEAFLNPKFNAFQIKQLKNLFITTMTRYDKNIPAHIVFPPEKINNTLGETLSQNNKIQLRVAETEKYAHVTYFFNGLREKPFPNEYRILVPSARIARHDENPRMMAEAITKRVVVSLRNGTFDFILVNYANPDMVAHTGNYHATIEAIKTVDKELSKLVKEVLNGNHTMIVTSDHGNAEVIFDKSTGQPQTQHDANPVPCYLVSKKFKKDEDGNNKKLQSAGLLTDIAPTVLELMDVPKPAEMTGTSLLSILQDAGVVWDK